ncbi:MAG: hypothetical protein FK734_08340 [Asgard group archaeon]|nr:hypothetical protein [Asgard group archaeon]
MVDKGTQTYFLTGSRSGFYQEIESELIEQGTAIDRFLENKSKPSNDIWISVMAQAVGLLAKKVEDNDPNSLKKSLLKFIAQLIIWYEVLSDDFFEELDIPNERINNPIFNTILIKQIGELSKKILQNQNKSINSKLKLIRSYCTKWIERLDRPPKTINSSLNNQFGDILAEFLAQDEILFENLEENFTEIK